MPKANAEADAANAAFGARVRARRMARGWTLRDLGAKAGAHWTYVGQVERGERNASLFTILRLAKAFDLDPGELLGGLTLSALPSVSDGPGTTDAVAVAGATEGQVAESDRRSVHEGSCAQIQPSGGDSGEPPEPA